ncbi:hypothetical protein QMP26_05640 [Enterocloster clostridioformis]
MKRVLFLIGGILVLIISFNLLLNRKTDQKQILIHKENLIEQTDTIIEKSVESSIQESTRNPMLEIGEVSEEDIQVIRKKIETIDFTIKDYPINTQLYNSDIDKVYKEMYLKALTNQIPIKWVEHGNKDIYYRELLRGVNSLDDDEFFQALKKMRYRYIDFDGDGLPELELKIDGPTVLKYNPKDEQVYLIYAGNANATVLGCGQVYIHYSSSDSAQYGFWMHFKDGNEVGVNFECIYDYDDKNSEWFVKRYVVSVEGYERVDVGEENWKQMSKDFFELIESGKALPTVSFEEIFQ